MLVMLVGYSNPYWHHPISLTPMFVPPNHPVTQLEYISVPIFHSFEFGIWSECSDLSYIYKSIGFFSSDFMGPTCLVWAKGWSKHSLWLDVELISSPQIMSPLDGKMNSSHILYGGYVMMNWKYGGYIMLNRECLEN